MSLANSSVLDPLFLSTAAKETAFSRLDALKVQRMAYPEYFQSFWATVLPGFFGFIMLWFSSVAVIVSLVADMVRYFLNARAPRLTRTRFGLACTNTFFGPLLQVIEKEVKREFELILFHH